LAHTDMAPRANRSYSNADRQASIEPTPIPETTDRR
jgi:hypothetical protein